MFARRLAIAAAGVLGVATIGGLRMRAEAAPAASPMDPASFKPFIVQSIKQVSHDTKVFRFELPAGQSLNAPTVCTAYISAHVAPLIGLMATPCLLVLLVLLSPFPLLSGLVSGHQSPHRRGHEGRHSTLYTHLLQFGTRLL
jgi:hypothetical protein